MSKKNFDWNMVNIRLHREDKPKMDEYIDKNFDDIDDIFDSISSHGYKVSMSYSDKQNSYIVTASWREGCKHNEKSSLSSWSDSALEALEMTSYKINVICKGGDWAKHATDTDNWG